MNGLKDPSQPRLCFCLHMGNHGEFRFRLHVTRQISIVNRPRSNAKIKDIKVKTRESLRSPVRMEEMEVNVDDSLDVVETDSPNPLRRINISLKMHGSHLGKVFVFAA